MPGDDCWLRQMPPGVAVVVETKLLKPKEGPLFRFVREAAKKALRCRQRPRVRDWKKARQPFHRVDIATRSLCNPAQIFIKRAARASLDIFRTPSFLDRDELVRFSLA